MGSLDIDRAFQETPLILSYWPKSSKNPATCPKRDRKRHYAAKLACPNLKFPYASHAYHLLFVPSPSHIFRFIADRNISELCARHPPHSPHLCLCTVTLLSLGIDIFLTGMHCMDMESLRKHNITEIFNRKIGEAEDSVSTS